MKVGIENQTTILKGKTEEIDKFHRQSNRNGSSILSIVLKPGSAGQPVTRSTRSWNRAGLKKKQEKKKPGMIRQPGQDPVANPLNFFLLKRYRFDLKKKLTRLKPRTWTLNWVGHRPGSSNYNFRRLIAIRRKFSWQKLPPSKGKVYQLASSSTWLGIKTVKTV